MQRREILVCSYSVSKNTLLIQCIRRSLSSWQLFSWTVTPRRYNAVLTKPHLWTLTRVSLIQSITSQHLLYGLFPRDLATLRPILYFSPPPTPIHYRIHKGPTLVPILSRIHQGHNLPRYLSKIYSNIIVPSTPRSCKWSPPFIFPTTILNIFLISPMRTTCPLSQVHLTSIYRTFREFRDFHDGKDLVKVFCVVTSGSDTVECQRFGEPCCLRL